MRAQRQKARRDRGGDGARDQRTLGRDNMRVARAATRDLRFEPKSREIVQPARVRLGAKVGAKNTSPTPAIQKNGDQPRKRLLRKPSQRK